MEKTGIGELHDFRPQQTLFGMSYQGGRGGGGGMTLGTYGRDRKKLYGVCGET
jgi:hypothetical protein